jgi:uncharacterized protein YecE (DUF72 family)
VFYPPRCPPRLWLDFYARHFDTVEVNATFYRLPRQEVVANWVQTTPQDFVLAVKMSRYITHVRRLRDLGSGVRTFYQRIEPLVRSPKLGPVLWQLPANFRRDDERLAGALEKLPAGRHCFEFRHESWFVPEVYEQLRSYGVALAIGDHPQRPFQAYELTADWTYVRFHSGSRGRRGNYSESELEEWAQRIEAWRREVDVFAYFNNDWEGFAVRNGLWLKERLGV